MINLIMYDIIVKNTICNLKYRLFMFIVFTCSVIWLNHVIVKLYKEFEIEDQLFSVELYK